MKNKIYDAIIIGAGPSGAQAALYLARANKKVLVFYSKEKGSLTYANEIENFYAQDKIKGVDLYKKGIKELNKFDIELINTLVTNITINYEDNTFTVGDNNQWFTAKALILALGKEKIAENFKIEAKSGVSYCAVCDGFFYKRKRLALIGSTEFAVTEFRILKNITQDITILTNSQKCVMELENYAIKCEKSISKIKNTPSNKVLVEFLDNTALEFDGVFIAEGDMGVSSISKQLGIETSQGNYIKVDDKMRTNINGIYACGDVIGGTAQIAKAVNDGMKTALSVINYLNNL